MLPDIAEFTIRASKPAAHIGIVTHRFIFIRMDEMNAIDP
jgi:hypothetical protein